MLNSIRSMLSRALRERPSGPPAVPGPCFEPLERRLLLSAVTLDAGLGSFSFTDQDGDLVTIEMAGPGTAEVTLDGDVADNADIDLIQIAGATMATEITVTVAAGETTVGSISSDDSIGLLKLYDTVIDGTGVSIDGAVGLFRVDGLVNGADLVLGDYDPVTVTMSIGQVVGTALDSVTISSLQGVDRLTVRDTADHLVVDIDGAIDDFRVNGAAAHVQLTANEITSKAIFGTASSDVDILVDADARKLVFSGAASGLTIDVGEISNALQFNNAIENADVVVDGRLRTAVVAGSANGVVLDMSSTNTIHFLSNVQNGQVLAGGTVGEVRIDGAADNLLVEAESITRRLSIAGTAEDVNVASDMKIRTIQFGGDAERIELDANANVTAVHFDADASHVSLDVLGTLGELHVDGDVDDVSVEAGKVSKRVRVLGTTNGIELTIAGLLRTAHFELLAEDVEVTVGGVVETMVFFGDVDEVTATIGGRVELLRCYQNADDVMLASAVRIDEARFAGNLEDSTIAGAGDMLLFRVGGAMTRSTALAGATLDPTFSLVTGVYGPAAIETVFVGDAMVDSVIAAGADPGADGLFADGESGADGRIGDLEVGGQIFGISSPHPNPGVYAGTIDAIEVNGTVFVDADAANVMTVGTAIIDTFA